MTRRLQDIIKRFDIDRDTRAQWDISGGLRLHPGAAGVEPARLELPADPLDARNFSLSTTLEAATRITNPASAKEWRGFQVSIEHVFSGTTQLTADRYRLSDGADTYWWDGGAWAVVTPLVTEWNTEADIANNIATFPITAQTIQVIINLSTSDKTVSPRIYGIKVLYGSDIDHHEDYITRSLVPTIKEGIRPIGRVLIAQQDTGTEFCFDVSDIETPYEIVDVDSVYDDDADPNHIVDLATAYDSVTNIVTLSASVIEGTPLFVRFTYKPQVAVRTSRDYVEVEKVPAIQLAGVEFFNVRDLKEDTVLNKDTNDGVAVKPGRMRDIELVVQFIADKLIDYQRMAQELTRYFTTNPLLRSRGLDEEFTILITDDPEMIGAVNSKDTHTGQLRIQILNAVFFERGSAAVFGVGGFNMGGSPESGYHNLTVTVP